MSTVLLDPAYGWSVGYGHLKRLAVLGALLERQGAVVAWRGRGLDGDVKALTSWAPWPVAAIESAPFDALVTDGTVYHPAEQAVPLRYALAGELREVVAERLTGIQCVYLQAARDPDVRGIPVRSGGRYLVVDPDLVDRGEWRDQVGSSPILVTFGGSELGRELTLELAENLHAMQWVVWPESYGEPPQFAPNISLIRDPRTTEMRQAFRFCRLVIGAFGMTTWEAIAAGLPGLYVSWTDGHAHGYEPLQQGLAVGHLGRAGTAVRIAHTAYRAGIITGHQRLNPMPIFEDLRTVRERAAFDGQGAHRIARDILRDIAAHKAGETL